jgi:hypothetical protein
MMYLRCKYDVAPLRAAMMFFASLKMMLLLRRNVFLFDF